MCACMYMSVRACIRSYVCMYQSDVGVYVCAWVCVCGGGCM